MLAAERTSWQNPRILTTLVLVFVCGALAGAITMRSGAYSKLRRNSAPYWSSDPKNLSYDKLRRDLDLTPDQASRMKIILDDFVKYHQDLEAQIEDVRATGRNRILQMLTPEQRKRFEKMSNELTAK